MPSSQALLLSRLAKNRALARPLLSLHPPPPQPYARRPLSSQPTPPPETPDTPETPETPDSPDTPPPKPKLPPPPPDFDDPDIPLTLDLAAATPSALPRNFGTNQHMHIDDALKDWLRPLLWQFRAPVRYAFAYGSGVFPQGTKAAGKMGKKPMVDLIFGVTYTQHWHSLNLGQHRDHYSFLGALGSGAVSYVQDGLGAGVYFNPYVEINGTLVKYGVVNLTTLLRDLSTWDTLYLSGRLQKPVKILRDDPQIRLANQINLLSAVRVALLLLPATFTEHALYSAIAGISYLGDPRMALYAEHPNKVRNIVDHQLHHFRRLYSPLVEQLPNVRFARDSVRWDEDPRDTRLAQDMDVVRRANMVRRLPRAFREKLYFQYQRMFAIPALEFEKMVGRTEDEERLSRKEGGVFERRIVEGGAEDIRAKVGGVIKSTIAWPSASQSMKGVLTAGVGKSVRYFGEKVGKWRDARREAREVGKE